MCSIANGKGLPSAAPARAGPWPAWPGGWALPWPGVAAHRLHRLGHRDRRLERWRRPSRLQWHGGVRRGERGGRERPRGKHSSEARRWRRRLNLRAREDKTPTCGVGGGADSPLPPSGITRGLPDTKYRRWVILLRPLSPWQVFNPSRAGWISMLLLEWLRKQWDHPTQGLKQKTTGEVAHN